MKQALAGRNGYRHSRLLVKPMPRRRGSQPVAHPPPPAGVSRGQLSNRIYVALAMLGLVACHRASTGAVTFGAAGPWTEAYGAMNHRGIELAVAEVNARPSWRSHPLHIEFRDDKGDGVQATSIAQEFVNTDSIVAVVGHVNSGAMVSAARVYDGHLPAVATTASSPALTGISSWTFRVISSDSVNGADIARFAARTGHKRAAILYENNSYGRGLTDAFRRAFSGEVVSVDPIDEGADQHLEPYLTYYKQRAPDMVFVAGTQLSGEAFLREARKQRFVPALMGGDGWTVLSADTALAEGVFVGAPFSDADQRAEARRFVAAFEQKYGLTPDGNAALAYDATLLLAAAVEKVGTDRRAIRDWLAALDSTSSFDGATGRIWFAHGDPIGKGIVMTRIHRGALEVAEGAR